MFNLMVEHQALDSVFTALADPTRRAMLASLALGDRSVGALAEPFAMSFAGASKHVKMLERAGLVRRRIDGRTHMLSIAPQPLADVGVWLEQYRHFWTARLDALEVAINADKETDDG